MRTGRRRSFVLLLVCVAAVTAAGTWIAGSRIRSPAEKAAQAAPPSPSIVTARVERRHITQQIVAQGEVRVPSKTQIHVSAASGAERLIISAQPVKLGDLVTGGEVVAEVSGRPVFVLGGAVPAYRALTSGLSGKDVDEFQEALDRAGFGIPVTGVFDRGTQGAVARLYAAAGYLPVSDGRNRIKLPVDEIAYVAKLPATVVSLQGLGTLVGDRPVVTLAIGAPVVQINLTPAEAAGVAAGQPARVLIGDNDKPLQARVSGEVRSIEGPNGESLLQADLTLQSSTLAGVSGKEATVTMRVKVSPGKVLAVPMSAVWTAPDGSPHVTVLGPGGVQVDVPIRAGVSAGGYVQVSSVSGRLQAGDSVVVG